MDPGTCNHFVIAWYYDRYAHRCREFFYSGCGGTGNKFATKEECDSQCRFTGELNGEEGTVQRCSQNYDVGTCSADIERWYFDWKLKRCVCSWWSGCGGNSNRFYSSVHCMLVCGQYAQAEPMFIQPDWIPPRPMYKDEPWAPKNHYPQSLPAPDFNRGAGSRQWQPPLPLHETAPPPRSPEHHHYTPEDFPQPDHPLLIHAKFPPPDYHVEQDSDVVEEPQMETVPILYDPSFDASSHMVTAPPYSIDVDYPVQPLPKADPYFTGKFDTEPQNFEQFESEAVLRGQFEVPQEPPIPTMASPLFERIPFSRRGEDLDNIFTSVPFAPDYEDDRIPYEGDYAPRYPQELRVGNEGFISGPQQNKNESDDRPEGPANLRDARSASHANPNSETWRQPMTTVTSGDDTGKRKRIKVPRRKPLLVVPGLPPTTMFPMHYATTTPDTQDHLSDHEIEEPAVTQVFERPSETVANEESLVRPVANIADDHSWHDDQTEHEGSNYADYYADMEEITDYDLPIAEFGDKDFLEVHRQEIPTEPAHWILRDPKFYHAAIPPHLAKAQFPTNNTEVEDAKQFEEIIRPEIRSNRVPNGNSYASTVSSIVVTNPDSALGDDLQNSLNTSIVNTTTTSQTSSPSSSTASTSPSSASSPVERLPERIPFRAPVPKPPKNQIDVWSWMRNARRRSHPNSNLTTPDPSTPIRSGPDVLTTENIDQVVAK